MTRTIDPPTITAALVGASLAAAGHPILIGVIAVSFLDLATGVAKAWATGTVESHRLGRGLYKILAYLAVGVALSLVGAVSDTSLIAANALAGAFLLREMLSIVENLHVIGLAMGVEIPAVTMLVRILRLNQSALLAEAGEPQPIATEVTRDV